MQGSCARRQVIARAERTSTRRAGGGRIATAPAEDSRAGGLHPNSTAEDRFAGISPFEGSVTLAVVRKIHASDPDAPARPMEVIEEVMRTHDHHNVGPPLGPDD